MKTLAEINAERMKLVYEVINKISNRKKIGVRYTTAQLSEMCDGLVSPEIFKRVLSRAEYQARTDKGNTQGRARAWKTEYSHLFGAWNLNFKAYPVVREYTVKWFDEDGQLVKTAKRYIHDYEAEFVLN